MQESKLICGDCGAEVKQVGNMLKCTNFECKMQIPIDVSAITFEDAMVDFENEHQVQED